MTALTSVPVPTEQELIEFRQEVRDWLEARIPKDWGTDAFAGFDSPAEYEAFLRRFQAEVYEAGWMGISWPKKYGGRGESIIKQAIFNEERERVHAPFDLSLVSVGMIGPMLMHEASEEQCLRYLSPMLRGEEIWCQGFSEPDAGSDLASLRTQAERVDDGWCINGQKVWTSRAHLSELMIVLARTDKDASRHGGIGAFIVPMDAPGLEVRRIQQINGEDDFAEVFFDDVLVPAKAQIGGPTDGWTVAIRMLMFERFANTRVFEAQRLFKDLLAEVRPQSADDPISHAGLQLADVFVDLLAARADYFEGLYLRHDSGSAGPAESVGKVVLSELIQRMLDIGLDALPQQVALEPVRPGMGRHSTWTYEFTNARKHTIAAGTSEVLRDLIAERVLGLPRA